MPSRALMLAIATVCAALAVATSAGAERPPTKAERAAILHVMPPVAYPANWYVLVIRISTVSPRWAAVHIRPRPGYKNRVQLDQGSFRKTHGRWKRYEIHDSCGVPVRARTDLNLPCF